MKSRSIFFAIQLMSICFFSAAQNSNSDFSKLYSLQGTWKMETTRGILYECWEKMNDTTLRGGSYKLTGKDTMWLERVHLIKKGDKIQYIPIAKDQNNNEAVVFTLNKVDIETYVFENLTHDFPQRIVYTLPQNNLLHAWIEGNSNGQFKKIDYNYSKHSTK